MLLTKPGCDVTLYPVDSLERVPLAYDNATSTFDIGTVAVEVYETVGAD